MRKTLIMCFVCMFAMVALAQQDSRLKGDHPSHYFVKKGDTLWDIANKFLKDPWEWPEIWHINPEIENPHLIFPGDKLSLVYVNGKPRLEVQRGDTSRTVTIKPRNPSQGENMSPRVRIEPITHAIPAIPLDEINAFLSRSRILEDNSLDDAPYVLAGDGGHIITGAGDQLYARGNFDPDERIYGVYRRGKIFQDPDTDEVLGIEAVDIGSGRVVAIKSDVATLIVNRSNEEIRNEDRLLPFQERKITATFYPKEPAADINGSIIAVEGGVTQVGTMDIVAMNRGDRDALEVGDVLAIYKTGELVRDHVTNELVQLPSVRAGILMVFSTFDKMSYGLVLNASRPLSVLDKVRNP
jgi:nucleoid-associated protein YgaU